MLNWFILSETINKLGTETLLNWQNIWMVTGYFPIDDIKVLYKNVYRVCLKYVIK